MEWTEVTITVPTRYTDAAADIAQMTVPYGLYLEDYSDLEEGAREIAHIDLIDEDLLRKDRTHSIVHIYLSPEANPTEALSFLTERYTAEKIPHTLNTAAIREEDWANNWKQYFKPLTVGERRSSARSGRTYPLRKAARCCASTRRRLRHRRAPTPPVSALPCSSG